MGRQKLIKPLIYLISFIFITNFLANKFYWYSAVSYFDMIMHFLGGFWVALLCVYLYPFKEKSPNVVLEVLAFVLLVGVGWEIYEMLVNSVAAQNPFDYLDTGSDLFFDLFGGSMAIFYFYKRIMFAKENGVQLK